MKMNIKSAFFALILFMLSFSCIATSTPRPIIIDTDAAIDDAIAILYLINRNDVSIKAITIAATGEAHCQPALHNLTGLIKMSGKSAIPIACGSNIPLAGQHQFPQWIVESADSLYHMTSYLPRTHIANKGDAVALLTKTLRASNQAVDIIALGPLTNIASVVKQHPELVTKIRMLYIMGGAVNVRGNVELVDSTKKNDAAEWNLYIDPKADDIVFRSGMHITLIPLDATNHVPVNDYFYQQLLKTKPHTASAKFVYDLFTKNQHNFTTKGWYFWDPLAAAIASDESIAVIETKKLRIVSAPESMAGATVVDEKNGNEVRVCVNADESRFTKDILSTIMKG